MAKVIGGMTVSLDGFIADENGDASALYPDLEAVRETGYMREMQEETGAALMGRRTFEMADDPDQYAESYEFQTPLFVLTSSPPEKHPAENENLTFTFVTDGLEAALDQAKRAAGEKAVTVVGGASVNQALLRGGLMDELRLDVMPVLLGSGLRLFDGLEGIEARLEKVRVVEVGERTSLRYRVR